MVAIAALGSVIGAWAAISAVDSLASNRGPRIVLALAMGSGGFIAYKLWTGSARGKGRLVGAIVAILLALTCGVSAFLLPPTGQSIPRYDSRITSRADGTRFVQWLYDHYEQEVYLKVEVTPGAMTENADPQEMSRPRRIAIKSDVCGSATLGRGELTAGPCIDSDVVLGLYPYRDTPESIDLWWTGGGVGAWTVRGTFIPNQAQGPHMGTFFIGLEERLTDVPPR